jgi:hypothetical protein
MPIGQRIQLCRCNQVPGIARQIVGGFVGAGQTNATNLFRIVLLALLVGQMAVYYDTATKTAPHVNLYLLVNLILIVVSFIPWRPLLVAVWVALWPAGAALR